MRLQGCKVARGLVEWQVCCRIKLLIVVAGVFDKAPHGTRLVQLQRCCFRQHGTAAGSAAVLLACVSNAV